jgi:probable HAF family extracellular repeat protein
MAEQRVPEAHCPSPLHNPSFQMDPNEQIGEEVMKKSNLSACVTATTMFVALAIPLSAQQPHYKLIDLGTFGGPASYVSGDGNGTSLVVNNGGMLTGSADTTKPDPFSLCFNDDCRVSYAFEWRNGVMTNLGALKDGVSSASSWISANGLIAGVSENGKVDPLISGFPENRAVLWRDGRITNLGTLEGGHESFANAVNSRAQVVGAALNKTPDPNKNSMAGLGYQTRAFLWEDGAMQDLGTLGTGTDAQAVLINDKGQVVGWSYIDSTTRTPSCNFPLITDSFIWDKEHGMVDLGSFGGTCTIASAMNNHGQIVGESNATGDQSSPAFIWENGSFKPLGGSLGGNFTGADAINEQGEAAGFAYLTNDPVNGPFHASLWKHIGNLTDLGTVDGDLCSFASAINAKTQVVGASAPDCNFDDTSIVRAFLWDQGSMFDLNALIPPGSPLYLQSAETINDRGEIAGTGVDVATGYEHAFVLIPCPAMGASDCEEGVGGATAATEARPAPLTQRLQIANPRNSIRQMLHRRLGPMPHNLALGRMAIGVGNTTAEGIISSLRITSGTPPSGTVGRLYDVRCNQIPPCNVILAGFPVTAAGGVKPYSWSWVAQQGSTLPPGLFFPDIYRYECLNVFPPAICGKPKTAGSYSVKVTVTDSESPPRHTTASYTIRIFP